MDMLFSQPGSNQALAVVVPHAIRTAAIGLAEVRSGVTQLKWRDTKTGYLQRGDSAEA